MSDDTPGVPSRTRRAASRGGASNSARKGGKSPRDLAYAAFLKNPQITGAELAEIGGVTPRQGQRWREQFEATRIHLHEEAAE